MLTSEAGPFPSHPPRYHYVGPWDGLPFGHRRDAFESFEAPVVPDEEGALIRLSLVPPKRRRSDLGLVYVCATVENGTSVPIGTSRSRPVQLASWWLDEDGRRLPAEPERSVQPWRANPHQPRTWWGEPRLQAFLVVTRWFSGSFRRQCDGSTNPRAPKLPVNGA